MSMQTSYFSSTERLEIPRSVTGFFWCKTLAKPLDGSLGTRKVKEVSRGGLSSNEFNSRRFTSASLLSSALILKRLSSLVQFCLHGEHAECRCRNCEHRLLQSLYSCKASKAVYHIVIETFFSSAFPNRLHVRVIA
jgi:hypothetical protein